MKGNHMELLGWIKNFGSYTQEQLEQLKQDFSLKMPIELLSLSANYYRSRAKRDPQIDELLLWDALYASNAGSAHTIAATELLTNDSFVAQTYADLMKKRSANRVNAKTPCTLGEAASTASLYLKRIGKFHSEQAAAPVLEDRKLSPLANVQENIFFPPASRFRLRMIPHQSVKAENEDWLVLLQPTLGQNPYAYQNAIGELLESPVSANMVVNLQTVDRGGLLKAILNLTQGAALDLIRLSKTGESVPLTLLSNGYHGMCLLRISKKSVSEFYHFAHQKNLFVSIFGTALNTAILKITRTNRQFFTIDTALLRSLVRIDSVSAQLVDEGTWKELSLAHVCGSVRNNPYLDFCTDHIPSEAMLLEGSAVANAVSTPQTSPFLHALYTTLAPICALSLSGYDYSKQTLSIGLNFPSDLRDSAKASACYSAVLGCYRAQAELAVPAFGVSMLSDESISDLEISVFSSTNGTRNTVPNQFARQGSYVYLIAVETDQASLPNFDTLRKLLSDLAAWASANKIQSARLLTNEIPTDALTSMSANGLFCKITDERIVSEGALPLAFIIESNEALPLFRIGTVEEKEAEHSQEKIELPTSKESLIWSEKAEIVVVAESKDYYAQELTSILHQYGADAKLFFSDEDTNGPLSHALLTANTLLVCKGVELTLDTHLRFALKVMKAANGRCIAFEKTVPDGYIAMPNGISKRNLEIICKKM